jgi:hypothetical protein
MPDYSIFYRRSINIDRITAELDHCDIYVSAYNSSERISSVFEKVGAEKKIWHIHPEYQYNLLEEPIGHAISRPERIDEISQVNVLIAEMGDLAGKSICVDITGFMRHVLVFLVAKLEFLGVRQFTAIYSEPIAYSKQEDTIFSTTTSGTVRPVKGMGGSSHSQGQDLLVVGVGYDYRLINEVSTSKDSMKVFPLFGFPSLSADMYQQSAIKAAESGSVAFDGTWITNRRFAPANDPFATAEAIQRIVESAERSSKLANVYLSPLSTKAQTLGFALFWLLEKRPALSLVMLMPECLTYSRETSRGLKRLWSYTVELY